MKCSNFLPALALLAGLSGCAVLKDTMVNPSGIVKVCSAVGHGAIGAAVADDRQRGCVEQLAKEGYLNLTEYGWTGLRFRNINDSVLTSRADENSPARKAGIPENADVLALNGKTPVDAADANRLVFGRSGAPHSIRLKTPEGIRDYTVAGAPLENQHQFFLVAGNIFFNKEDALSFHRESFVAIKEKMTKEKRAVPLFKAGVVRVPSLVYTAKLVAPNLTEESKAYVTRLLYQDIRGSAEVLQASGIFETTTIVESDNLAEEPKPLDVPQLYAFAPDAGAMKWLLAIPGGKTVSILPDEKTLDHTKFVKEVERVLEKYSSPTKQ